MRATRASRIGTFDLYLCRKCNRIGSEPVVRFFAAVSRLGDGGLWYGLMTVLPIAYGPAALPGVAQMLAVGAAGLGVYRVLKARVARPRPYLASPGIRLLAAPLDRYSFPSGHTLHAVSFTLVASSHYPETAWLLAPFTGLVALSRVVLGLHYPSDVIAGAAVGTTVYGLSLAVF